MCGVAVVVVLPTILCTGNRLWNVTKVNDTSLQYTHTHTHTHKSVNLSIFQWHMQAYDAFACVCPNAICTLVKMEHGALCVCVCVCVCMQTGLVHISQVADGYIVLLVQTVTSCLLVCVCMWMGTHLGMVVR